MKFSDFLGSALEIFLLAAIIVLMYVFGLLDWLVKLVP